MRFFICVFTISLAISHVMGQSIGDLVAGAKQTVVDTLVGEKKSCQPDLQKIQNGFVDIKVSVQYGVIDQRQSLLAQFLNRPQGALNVKNLWSAKLDFVQRITGTSLDIFYHEVLNITSVETKSIQNDFNTVTNDIPCRCIKRYLYQLQHFGTETTDAYVNCFQVANETMINYITDVINDVVLKSKKFSLDVLNCRALELQTGQNDPECYDSILIAIDQYVTELTRKFFDRNSLKNPTGILNQYKHCIDLAIVERKNDLKDIDNGLKKCNAELIPDVGFGGL